jgi:hypothetical protein
MGAGLLLPCSILVLLSLSACGPQSSEFLSPLPGSTSSTTPPVSAGTASVPAPVSVTGGQTAALTPAVADATIAEAISRQSGQPTTSSVQSSSGRQSRDPLTQSVCETQGRQNTDWVMNDSGARATYRDRLFAGSTAFDAVLAAQAHNPKAQAILLGCQNWVQNHLLQLGQPQRDLALCTTEARQNVDWVLNNSGARATYRNRLGAGDTLFEALVAAQGHNPKAQATLRTCQVWVKNYLLQLGQPDQNLMLSNRRLTNADCQCVSVSPTGDYDWQQRQAYRVTNSCDALAVAVNFTGDIASYSPNPAGFSSVAQVGRLDTNQQRRVRAPDWKVVSVASFTLRSTAGSLTCPINPLVSSTGGSRDPSTVSNIQSRPAAKTAPAISMPTFSAPKIAMPDVNLDEVIDLGIGILGLLNAAAGIQNSRPVYTPAPVARQPTTTYGTAPPPKQKHPNHQSTITGTQ